MAGVNNSSDSAPLHDAWTRQYSIVCVAVNMNANFRGVWYGDNPFDFVLPTLMAKIILVSLISRLLYCLLRPLKQPKFVCYVLGGIVLGPSVLGRKKEVWKTLFPPRESELFLTLAIIGGLYSVFLIGVKMDASLVVRSARNSWRIGLLGFLSALVASTSLLFSLVAGQLPGILLRGPFMFYVPLSLCFTFFPVLAHALEELDLLNSELGQLAMSSAVLNDLIYWVMLGASIAFRQETMSHSVMGLFSFMALVLFSFTVLRRAVHSIVRRTPEGKPVKELYIVAVMLGVLLMAFVSSFIGATSILGALLLGFVIPCGPPLGSALVQKTEALVSEFLMPLFFVRVGYSVDVRAIHDWPVFVKFQAVIAVAYAAKFVGTLLTSLSCKIRFKTAVMLGLIMNIKGILELIHYHRWKSNKYIDDQIYTQLVLSTIGVTMIVTPLIKLLSKRQARLDPSRNLRGLRTLRSMVRNSEFRILCCIHGEENVHGMITLLEASNPSPSSPICAYVVQASELTGLAAPLLVPFDRRRRKLNLTFSATTDQIVRAFENYSKNSRGPVVIMPFIMVASYKTMHESICRLSREKFIPLVIVPFHRSHRYGGGGVMAAALRQFNVNVQAHAPCTVGILVDRGLSHRITSAHFSYHVAVVFIGGPDDREAMAYAAHMADHQSQVTVTVVRILLRKKKEAAGGEEDEQREREAAMDDAAMEDFRLLNVGNACTSLREVEVEDVAEAMNAVRSAEGHFNLIMVGRRQSWAAATEEEESMSEFLENEELGVIGDMLASSDFCGRTVSVLVVQHHMRELGVRTTLRSSSAKSTTTSKSAA